MKVVFIPKPPRVPCDCWPKLADFYRQSGSTWPVGTKVECDCGKKYVLSAVGDPPTWTTTSTRVTVLA